jgi:hypothetical protein
LLDFRAETPLGRAVQELLREAAEGLTAAEIRHQLSRTKGLRVSEDNLRELLKDGRVFVISNNGRFVLAGSEPAKPSRARTDPAGDLHEQSGLYKQAHIRLLAAGKATNDVGEINKLSQRRYNIGKSMDEQKAKGIEQDWRQHAATLLDNPDFLKLVNESEFRRMLS